MVKFTNLGLPGGASGKEQKIQLPVQEMPNTGIRSLSWEGALEEEIGGPL